MREGSRGPWAPEHLPQVEDGRTQVPSARALDLLPITDQLPNSRAMHPLALPHHSPLCPLPPTPCCSKAHAKVVNKQGPPLSSLFTRSPEYPGQDHQSSKVSPSRASRHYVLLLLPFPSPSPSPPQTHTPASVPSYSWASLWLGPPVSQAGRTSTPEPSSSPRPLPRFRHHRCLPGTSVTASYEVPLTLGPPLQCLLPGWLLSSYLLTTEPSSQTSTTNTSLF